MSALQSRLSLGEFEILLFHLLAQSLNQELTHLTDLVKGVDLLLTSYHQLLHFLQLLLSDHFTLLQKFYFLIQLL
jgi:hypothetical protein